MRQVSTAGSGPPAPPTAIAQHLVATYVVTTAARAGAQTSALASLNAASRLTRNRAVAPMRAAKRTMSAVVDLTELFATKIFSNVFETVHGRRTAKAQMVGGTAAPSRRFLPIYT
mmetsp:Transcript_33067/g.75619  ORF Transcript_33067/g.75619 Transcript_33067/m.75619 type:complete len:115 (-) Transcript_33067:182-526(-)